MSLSSQRMVNLCKGILSLYKSNLFLLSLPSPLFLILIVIQKRSQRLMVCLDEDPFQIVNHNSFLVQLLFLNLEIAKNNLFRLNELFALFFLFLFLIFFSKSDIRCNLIYIIDQIDLYILSTQFKRQQIYRPIHLIDRL